MRALSVRQPWAWAIIHAGKNIENRTWHNKHTIGTIAIHASKGLLPVEDMPPRVRRPQPAELVRSAIIGIVDVVDVVENHRSRWFHGPLGWVLKNPRALTRPIECQGALGLWAVPRSIERRIMRQLERR